MDRTEISEPSQHIYSQLRLNTGTQSIQRRNDSLFDKCCWGKCISIYRRLKLGLYLLSYPLPPHQPKINQRPTWKALTVNPFKEKNQGNDSRHLCGQCFFLRVLKTQYKHNKRDKWYPKQKVLYNKRKFQQSKNNLKSICHLVICKWWVHLQILKILTKKIK